MAAHATLKKAGLYDVQDAYFWVDPFSPEGQQVAAKLVPVAPELRLHAERAITLLAQARAAGKLDNPEALDAIELGARRIDFIGYKFQAAEEMRIALCKGAVACRRQEPLERSVGGVVHDRFEQRTP